MTRTRALTLAAASALVLGSIGTATVAHAQQSADAPGCQAGPPIVGSWRMTVSPPAPAAPFHTLVEFQQGGTMTDAIPQAPASRALSAAGLAPDDVTSAVGSWTWSNGAVHFSFEHFLTQGGVYVARQHVTGTATVTAGCAEQKGSAQVTFWTPGGTQLGPEVTVTTDGTRFMP
jgi:hypothetical protein